MNGKAIIKFLVVIAAIIGLFAYFIQPLAGSLKQGLDLQGGTHIVLEAEDLSLIHISEPTRPY